MRRLKAVDATLLVSLLALWCACTALHVKQVASGRLAWVGVYVDAASDAEDYPVVRGFWPGATPEEEAGLEVGDHIRRIGDLDLRGVGPLGFVARAYEAAAAQADGRFTVTYDRGGRVEQSHMALVPVALPWRMLPLTCTLVLTGTLVLLRRPGARIARAFFLVAIFYSLHWTFFFGGPRLQTYAWAGIFFVASTVMWPLILRVVLVFPAEVAPAGGMPWWPWLFAIFGPLASGWVFGVPLPPELAFRGVFVINILFIATICSLLTRNFRRAGAKGRRQLKWVVLGTYVGTMPVLVADVVAAIEPSLWWLHEVAVIAEICIPICMMIAVVRANLFDVDRLLTVAAVYSILSVLLLAMVLAAVPRVARAAGRRANMNPQTVQLLLSLVVAGAAVPANRALRPRLEQLLFRERHALQAGIEDLLRDLAAASRPEELLTLVGERLDALVGPQSCAIYAPIGDRFAPVFARGEGRQPPPALSAAAAAAIALQTRTAPLDFERAAPPGWRDLGADERAALESLHAAALLPVRRGDELAAAICLGAKRSGDIYTATDLALLAAVADKVSGELMRFDADEILGQERRMSDALRRYVPRSVAARLTRGQSIEGGECDVSILFVDIRGYTTYSEQREAGAVFSMINRYTEAVSAVIQRRGGTVVEFLGDGVMAVFGAPEALPEHARVAVQAGREVVEVVRELSLEPREGDGGVAVGVGIASGRAFVGNIRTSDRFVYTAVGDVVNLASRIQGLTRELHAAVAIDARTHRTAGDSAIGFRRHERVAIRGRSAPEDVYSLPLAAA